MKKDTEVQMNNLPKDFKDPKPEERAKLEVNITYNSIIILLDQDR